MKFNFKSRSFVGAVIIAILAAFGFSNAPAIAPVLTEITCEAVGCDNGDSE
jgi:hypothetical protein